MREIKFRAWDRDNETMKDMNYYGTPADTIKMFFQHDWELMQYTGLKDENGKEIYEGDILKGKSYLYGYQLEPYGEQFDYFGVVKWQSQCDVGLCWILEDTKGGAWDLNQTVHRNAIDYCTGEVIGNIYENPELLEATND